MNNPSERIMRVQSSYGQGYIVADLSVVGELTSASSEEIYRRLESRGCIHEGQMIYPFSDDEVEWSLRMIIGEGIGDTLEVLRCMIQRWVALGGPANRAYPSYLSLIRAYSQPINEIWYRGGRHTPRGMRTKRGCGKIGVKDKRHHCSEARLRRRDRLERAQIDTLRKWQRGASEAVDEALAFLAGEQDTDKVNGAVHFAVKSLVLKNHAGNNPSNPGIVYKRRGHNWFYAPPATRDWRQADVMVVQFEDLPGPPAADDDDEDGPVFAPVTEPDPGLHRPDVHDAPTPDMGIVYDPPSKVPPRKKVDARSLVRALQKELHRAGLNPGGVDGVMGPKTWKAIDRWDDHNRRIQAAFDGLKALGDK